MTEQYYLASNAGGVRVQPLRWVASYPMWPTIWLLLFGGCVALAFNVHWAFWPLVLFFGYANFLYWRRVKGHFQFGDANPGLIVYYEPMLIAVATDLQKDSAQSYPVVKIIEKKLSKVGGQPAKTGQRVATVSLYMSHGDQNSDHWADFDPRPLETATTQDAEIRSVMESFSENSWQELEEYLKQVPQPPKPGLYKIGWGSE